VITAIRGRGYLDHALNEIRQQRLLEGVALTRADLQRAIMTGAVERLRPKMMTGRRDLGRIAADPLEHGYGFRSNAAHRRTNGRRDGLVHPPHPARHSRDLRDRQGMAATSPCRNARPERLTQPIPPE
jgi:hypothetical protein